MGKYGQFTSLTRYTDDIIVNFTIMALIIIGGIGFLVWDDIGNNGFCFKKYQLHTKIVLTTTAILIISGSLLFYLFEANATLANLNIYEKF